MMSGRGLHALFFLLPLGLFGQSKPVAMLDSVIAIARSTSMYAETVNWDSLQVQLYQKAEKAKKAEDLKPAFETLLNALRDHHGRILRMSDYSNLAYFTDYRNRRYRDPRPKNSDVWAMLNDTASHFSYLLLDGHIGYLKIVSVGPGEDVVAVAKNIRMALLELYGRGANSWIIDLRYNGGGNMHPMMAGIAPLVGEGKVGSVVTLDQKRLFDWEIKNNNFIYAGYQAIDLQLAPAFKSPPAVAVLTSRYTVSSGELVATALKGRPATRFFGEATGGFTTNNGWVFVGGELIVNISTGIYCDRSGNVYPHNLPVDQEVVFQPGVSVSEDAGVRAAMDWLKGAEK